MNGDQVNLNVLINIKRQLRKNIETDQTALANFIEESAQLKDILERVVKLGESDSVLIIGAPYSGKTSLIKKCINDTVSKFGDDSFTLVNLNGFVHINDNLALQEIIKSLQVQNLPEDSIVTGSFADNLTFVLRSFKSGERSVSKPIVFIMDNFECFCEHRNQTLLYNLFDVAQSAQAPICVVGITPRIDITELFEKRVKSRFSQRQVSIYLNHDYKYIIKLFTNILTLSDDSKSNKSVRNEWNKSIKELMVDKNVIKTIRQISDYSPNLKYIKHFIYLLTSLLNDSHSKLDENDFSKILSKCNQDSKVLLIKDLSVLELCLIIAMKHQNEIYDDAPLNFEMIYKRYMKFAIGSSVNVIQHSVVYKAFERLKEMEIIIPIGGHGVKSKKKEFILYNFTLTNQQIDNALSSYDNLPTDVTQWASSSLS